MLIKDVKKLSPMERFLYFITEREAIRLKKETGEPKPWTDDEILQSYRFCNVRRMDDKVSQWLLNNWYEPNFDHPNMLVACTLARHFNLPSVLAVIGFPKRWDPVRIKRVVRAHRAAGNNVFNGAYMVRGIGTADKTEMVVDKVCQPIVSNPPRLNTDSMQRSVESLLPYWGISSFMGGQIVADLRWAVSGLWGDRKVWAPVGPGSLRGMNRLLQRPIKQGMKQEEFLEYLQDLIGESQKELPLSITSRLEAIDWQNCCCEYDKMERTLFDGRRPKQLYRGSV